MNIHAYAITGGLSKERKKQVCEMFAALAAKKKSVVKPYVTSLWIGTSESRVRTAVENIESKDSRVSINGALDKFYAYAIDKDFSVTVKHHNILGGFSTVVGQIKTIELMDIVALKFEPKAKMTMLLNFEDGRCADHDMDEILMHGYFFLGGQIKGESHSGKQYNEKTKMFKDVNIVDVESVSFTSLNFWYDRLQKSQELLSIP